MIGFLRAVALALTATLPAAAAAMAMETVTDLSYFQKEHPVIFPGADIKLCLIEFEAPRGSAAGKELTHQLYEAYGRRIAGLPGAAVVAWVAGPGLSISNFRVKAEEVGASQKAQLAVWGRVLLDTQGRPLLAPRLTLLAAPPGLSASFTLRAAKGVLQAPIARGSIDFAPADGAVDRVAAFLSGVAHYVKGAALSGSQAKPWLTRSVADLADYLRGDPQPADPGAAAQAHLFSARALARLGNLAAAGEHAATAANLNPYDPAIPQAQAVIALLQRRPPGEVRAHLAQAVRLAPADPSARLDLALLEAAEGDNGEAMRSIDGAKKVQGLARTAPLPGQQQLERDVRRQMR